MKVLTTDIVASIKACNGIYRAVDVANHYGVHRSTVTRIYNGQAYTALSPANDFPDINTRLHGDDLYETTKTLLGRGYTVREVMNELGVCRAYVYTVRGILL